MHYLNIRHPQKSAKTKGILKLRKITKKVYTKGGELCYSIEEAVEFAWFQSAW